MSKLHALYVCLRNQVYSFACLLREKYLLFPLLAAMAVIITMFLYEAEPFNISIWHDRFKLLKLSGYGFIYAGMLGLTILGIKRKYVYPETLNWTSLLNLLFILSVLVFIIGILNWIYTLTVYRHYQANWVSFFLSIRHTVTFSLFPFFFYMIHLGYKLNLIPGFVRNAIKRNLIWFDKSQFIVSDILYIKADENYVTVYYLRDNTLMKEYVRYSLKRVEEDLSDFTGFFRVHRSYVVNLNYVDSSFSKLNSMKLNFEKIPEQIPVGREYQKRVKQKLNQ